MDILKFIHINSCLRLLAILPVLFAAATPADLTAATVPEVLMVVRDPSHAVAKIALLKEAAQKSGIRLRHVFAASLQDDDYRLLYQGAALVLFDTGKKIVADDIDARAATNHPVSMVQLMPDSLSAAGRRGKLTQTDHERLYAYYHNGGRRNFENMFRYLATTLFETAREDVSPPVVMPDDGVYHPDLPGQVSASVASYLAWKGRDSRLPGPVIALVFPRAFLVNGQMSLPDAMIRQIEETGAMPLAVFFTDRPQNQGALQRLLVQKGAPAASVIIYMGALHVPGDRRAEIEAMGIPVLGTIKYRPGLPEDWRKSTAGVSMAAIPTGYATPEYAGFIDPMVVATESRDNKDVLLREQFGSVINKALKLARLQTLPHNEKQLVIFYYNTPPGEQNLSASNLNIPESLQRILEALAKSGYRTATPEAADLTRYARRLLAPFYRPGELEGLLRDGLAETLPVDAYQTWFDTLPEPVRRNITTRWGRPEHSSMVATIGGKKMFVIPRILLGNVAVTRQPPRGDRIDGKEKSIYHDTKLPPNHYYLACYLWARQSRKADALIHLGTHGTQEWMPGKERGLSIHDAPNLAVGDVPVVYPYIVANIGEAIQAKRRGRAVIISHQTPPYAPSGLYDDLLNLHELIHQYAAVDTPSVRVKLQEDIIRKVLAGNYEKDMGWTAERMRTDFSSFLESFHAHLHTLAEAVQPLGLHSFGATPQDDHRLFTVMQMLGKPFYRAVFHNDEKMSELFTVDYKQMKETEPYRLLERHIRKGEPLPSGTTPELSAFLEKGRRYYANFDAAGEIAGILKALSGRHIPASTGDDPIRNPDSHPTGRNMYGFDPAKVPSRQAWEAGREAMASLMDKFREKNGRRPKKLSFILWSVETMRQHGVVEAQILHALGVRPVWDDGGRVTGIEVIPAGRLGRPRIDILVTASGAYRDMFPNALKHIEEAVAKVAALQEPDNAVRIHTAQLESHLVQKGMKPEQAHLYSLARIFSNANGVYGLKIDAASLASDTWGEGPGGRQDRRRGEAKLADLYMSRIGYLWGEEGDRGQHKELFAENLKKVDAAVLARSSNLYGVVNTDDPFQFLGGIGLAVRHLTGKNPELYIADLRIPGKGKAETVSQFLATEMRTRYFHPNWVAEMKKEGYAGAVEMVKVVNNFWGWQTTAPEAVRADQWQELADVYIHDKHRLGLKEWFEKENPAAQAQLIERMLEAVRKEYWSAPQETVAALKKRYRELAGRYAVQSDNRAFQNFVYSGYGIEGGSPLSAAIQPRADTAPPAASLKEPQVRGLQLQRVPAAPKASALRPLWLVCLAPLLAFVSGSLEQVRHRKQKIEVRRPYAKNT